MLEAGDDEVRCSVEVGGRVSSHQGLNLPGAEVGLPAAGREDLAWVDFAIEQGIDLLAVSFVRRAEDLAPVERRVRTGGSDIPVIAKIEKPQAAERAEEIVKAVTAGVMIARGDLGIELPIEQVPGVQRRLLALAGKYSRPSITATQMLASMVASPRPTRAEVSDVANAIFQGTDAVMLSEETAVGQYPAEAVARDGPDRPRDRAGASLRRLGLQPGPVRRLRRRELGRPRRGRRDLHRSASRRSSSRPAAAAPRGSSPRIARATPVLAISPRLETVRRLNLLFGVQCEIAEEWTGLTALLDDCARLARESGVANSGDLIAITAGPAAAEPGHEPVRDPPRAVGERGRPAGGPVTSTPPRRPCPAGSS